MAKSKSNRFFGLPSKCKCGLSLAVLSYDELSNEFTRVQVGLGGDCDLVSIPVRVILFEIWNEFWNEVLTLWFVWDWTQILLAGRNLEGLYFQKKRLSGIGSWQEQTGVQTVVHYLARAYLDFRESSFWQGTCCDYSRTVLTSCVLIPISILLNLRKNFPQWLTDQGRRELNWIENQKQYMLLSHSPMFVTLISSLLGRSTRCLPLSLQMSLVILTIRTSVTLSPMVRRKTKRKEMRFSCGDAPSYFIMLLCARQRAKHSVCEAMWSSEENQ